MMIVRHPREGGDPFSAISSNGTGRSAGPANSESLSRMGPRLRGDDAVGGAVRLRDNDAVGGAVRLRGDGAEQKVARDFEALFIAQLLKAARAAHLADDPLAADDSAFRDAQDRDLAQRLAAAAPLGVAKLLTPAAPLGVAKRLQ